MYLIKLETAVYQGKPIIKDLEIIDPYLAAQIFGVKDSDLDVRATLDNNSTVIIEMQVINVAAFGKIVF
ncbi:MAG: PD-(D/E)XK nuclease family transposase [Microcoleaceae cyanobacterium]